MRANVAIGLALAFAGCTESGTSTTDQPAPSTSSQREIEPKTSRDLPWLPGLAVVAATETAAPMDVDLDDDCPGGSLDVMALGADVVPGLRRETVLASVAHGVVVIDHEDQVVTSSRPIPCGGSADTILALAIGDAGLVKPVIVVVAEVGGRAESTTWLAILQVSRRKLRTLFAGPIAMRDGDEFRRGKIAVTNGVVAYQPIDGPATFIRLEEGDPP
jgi:hypothetical protein